MTGMQELAKAILDEIVRVAETKEAARVKGDEKWIHFEMGKEQAYLNILRMMEDMGIRKEEVNGEDD